MKKRKILVLSLTACMAILLFGCGSSSETEEATTEEVIEETSETEIEEEPEENEEEAEDVEEVTEEGGTTTETEAIDEDTMAALKEALDPDVHLIYDDLGGAQLMPLEYITFDDTATEAINTLYELVYKETLGVYGEESAISMLSDNIKVAASYYYREQISKEEYYEAIFDSEYYDTLLASLSDGTYEADESETYFVIPGTETSKDTNTSTNNDNTGTSNTNTNNNNSGSSGDTGSTGSTGSGSGTNAAVETYDEPDEDGVWDTSGVTIVGANGEETGTTLTDGSQYQDGVADNGLTPENTNIR